MRVAGPGTVGVGIALVALVILGAVPLEGAQQVVPAPLSRESLEQRFRAEKWDAKAPVDIQSKQMQVNFNEHRIVFLGDVRVTQADFSLSANEVTAVFGENAEDIRKIVAKGDVTIQKADKVAWGNEATYNREEAMIVLSGNPSLQQGGNYIKGDEIRVFLNEDRMDVQGGVKAEFRLQEQPGSGK